MALSQLVAKLRADISKTDQRVSELKQQVEQGKTHAPIPVTTVGVDSLADALLFAKSELEALRAEMRSLSEKLDARLAEQKEDDFDADMLTYLTEMCKEDGSTVGNPWAHLHTRRALAYELESRRLKRDNPDAAIPGWC